MVVIAPRFCKTLGDCFVEILTSSLELHLQLHTVCIDKTLD